MRIVVDCEKIKANAEAIVGLCAPHGIEVVGVSKVVCGEPEVVRAMLAGGVGTIAESRIGNVRRIRAAGIDCPVMMLRLPQLSEVDEVVTLTQISLNSEEAVLRALSQAAIRHGVVHQIVLIIEGGDRREGVMPGDALALCHMVDELPGLDLAGLAVSLNCLCGVLPSVENQRWFAETVENIERALGRRFRIVSGGHTNNLRFVMDGLVPERVSQLRVGEGIIFGTDITSGTRLPAPHTDAFAVYAEVIELKDKPSAPEGELGIDAFMRTHEWPDLGIRRRAVLAMGEVDVGVSYLKPLRDDITLISASSDHTVVDVTEADPPVKLGDELAFSAEYTAIAYGWSSTLPRREVLPLP